MTVKDAELISVFGRRGCGKSTLTKSLIKDRPKVVVFDPMAEYSGRGWSVVRSRVELARVMTKKWHKGFKIAYVPTSGNELEALHFTCEVIWRAQALYDEGRDNRKLTLVVEEANLGLPTTPLPRDRSAMLRVINQGRHRGIEAIAVTQRPALLNSNFRGNAARSYVFALSEANDVDAVIRMAGREHREMLRTLGAFSFVCLENGKILPGRTLKNGQFKVSTTYVRA